MRGSFLAVLAGACLTMGATMAEQQPEAAASAHASGLPTVLGVVTESSPIVLEVGDAVVAVQVLEGKILQFVVAGAQGEPVVREEEYSRPSLVMFDSATRSFRAMPLLSDQMPEKRGDQGPAEAHAGGGNVPPTLPDPSCTVGFNPVGAQCYNFMYTIGQATCYGQSCVGAPAPDGSYCVTTGVTCYIGCRISGSSTTLCIDMTAGTSCKTTLEGMDDRNCDNHKQ